MRYMVLAYVITLQRISLRVKRRFPGLQHLVDSGLMLESEKKIFEIMDSKSPMSKWVEIAIFVHNFVIQLMLNSDIGCRLYGRQILLTVHEKMVS